MANTEDRLRSLALSAADLQSVTDWNDVVIEEWLNIIRNLSELAISIDATGEAAIGGDPVSSAKILALQAQVGSGNFLTWDETGFSWDSDKLSFDQDEA